MKAFAAVEVPASLIKREEILARTSLSFMFVFDVSRYCKPRAKDSPAILSTSLVEQVLFKGSEVARVESSLPVR